ncbi:hypothetical protein HN371_08440 [Candidatus Poribacteria bacterium]|nr:hypothetical protein [Candidatus Poribacteria bacterium]MBT5709652.1 hypothetical protein [Candidatus Poribacteria bacterium]MBT7100919.1 hypothetical protein [Candidatus Poribacteria bacterium]MBT7809032.1 hypothetical protein [Candidatus Poribacteria bacterium]
MRWAQLAFVEDDPETWDLGFWLDYFRRTHSEAACLSAGGCVAFYPTEIPLHHRSNFLGDTDIFGDLVAGCREMDMVVIARTDPHSVLDDARDAHPEWIAVDAEGEPRRHWATPNRWVTCALGPYNFEFMTDVHREIMALYGLDGIFSNRWTGHGMCYCEHCATAFDEAWGMELPRTRDLDDAAFLAHLTWRQDRLFSLWRLWDDAIREINPDSRFIPNSGGGALSPMNMKKVGEIADFLVADRQSRRGLMPPWANGKNAKEFRATMGNKPIAAMFNVGIEEPHRWKDSVQNGAELRIWAADAIANGMRPWFIKFCANLHDERWLAPVEDIFARHKAWEPYLRNERPLARAGLVYSQRTATYYGGERAAAKVEHHTLGMYHALTEARIPFEMVHDELLDAEHLGRLRTLILPNIAAMSDAQCEQIREFVARGGSVVATMETSLYDESGARRENLGLADLFGADVAGPLEGPTKNSYLRVDAETRHPLLRGLEMAGRIINGVYWLPVAPREVSQGAPLTLIPAYPDLPMEEVYPRQAQTDIPAVYARQVGAGRVVYFPWDIDRVFWEVLSVDHGVLLRNAVTWATHEPPVVTVAGPGVLDVTVWQQAESMTVHLVNLTNPMMMKGPFRELLPVGRQTVSVRMPEGRTPKSARLLAVASRVAYDERDGYVTVDVPSVLDHEVVAIDF